MRRLALLCVLLCFNAVPLAEAQVVTGRQLTVGSSPSLPDGSSVRLDDLGTSGGTKVLFTDNEGDVFERLLGKSDLPSTVGYTDEAETWSLLQTFSSGLTSMGAVTAGAGIASSHYASQATGWGITHAGAADFRYLYVDEMHAKSFIADLEMALNGGQIITKSSAILSQDFTCPSAGGAATLRVNDFPGSPNIRVFATNDWVVLRTFTRTDGDSDGNSDLTIGDCVGQVSNYTDGVGTLDGTQAWTFTRGSGGNAGTLSGGTVIAANAVVLGHGVSGNGYLEASAIDGAEGANSPYWQLVTWTTSPVAANRSLRARWGNLNGSYGYTSKVYGTAFGNPSDVWLSIDDTNGIRIFEGGSTLRGQWAVDGTLTIGSAGTGAGNVQIASNAINLRSGTTTRLQLAANNGEINIYDPSGTPRTTIGSGYAAFGRVATGEPNVWIEGGALSLRNGTITRIGLDAGNGAIRMYDTTGTMRAYLGDRGGGVYGLLLGNSLTPGQSFVDIRSDGEMRFCAAGVGCTLTFYGNTGSIVATGNLALNGTATIGSGVVVSTNGLIRSGQTAYATGTGYYLDYNGGTPRLSIGSPGRYLRWSGSSLTVQTDELQINDNGLITNQVEINHSGVHIGNAFGAFTIGGQAISYDGGNGYFELSSGIAGSFLIVGGSVTAGTGFSAAGQSGLSETVTVRNAAGTGTCTLVYTGGIKTGGTC